MGKVISVSDLMPVTRSSDYDKDIEEALKMPTNSAYMIELGERKLDSVNVALRERIKKSGYSQRIHVEVRKGNDGLKGVYILHGPSSNRPKVKKKP